MEPKQQITLTKDILRGILEDITAKIESGKIPESWDGIEPREYIADQARWHNMPKGRAREYRNTVMVNGL